MGTLGRVELGALTAGKMIVTNASAPTFQVAPNDLGQDVSDNISGAPAFLLDEKGKSLGLVGIGQNKGNPESQPTQFLSVMNPEVSSFIFGNL